MAAHPFDLWRLALTRALIAQAAPRVSLSAFFWNKDPGNEYVTFYPTAWAREHADVGTLFGRTQGRRVHLASYGDHELRVPWLTPEESRFARVLSPRTDRDPRRAAEKAASALDLDHLAAEGDVDPDTHARVLRWLDEVLSAASAPDAASVSMDLGWQPRADACFDFEVRDRAGRVRRIAWR